MSRYLRSIRNSPVGRLLIVVPLILVGLFYFSRAYGAELPLRSLLLSDNRAGATATYQLGFNIPGTETLGSIRLLLCANSPLLQDPCTAPSGFDISAASLSGQTGQTGFSILPSGTNANTLTLTRIPVSAGAGSVSYTLSGVVNPSAAGSFYARLQTFPTTDASGPENDHGGMAMSINGAIQINTTVPPYLLFCSGVTITGFDCATASGSYINFGDLASSATSSADSQLLTATNAGSGFSISVNGPTMTSGNNIINNMDARDVSRPGVSQFGMNLVANQTPAVGQDPQGTGAAQPTSNYGQLNFFKYTTGDAIASTTGPDEYRKFTASYILNIPTGQTPGVYVTTLTYICLANF